ARVSRIRVARLAGTVPRRSDEAPPVRGRVVVRHPGARASIHHTVTYRVIQWSTGNVGRYALRGIVHHPDLELAGLWVHSEKKGGLDAAELCGLEESTGVVATNDVEEVLAIDADCVCYTATGDLRGPEALEDLTRIAGSGKNIVSSSLVPLVWPAHVAVWAKPLEDACRAAGVSAF